MWHATIPPKRTWWLATMLLWALPDHRLPACSHDVGSVKLPLRLASFCLPKARSSPPSTSATDGRTGEISPCAPAPRSANKIVDTHRSRRKLNMTVKTLVERQTLHWALDHPSSTAIRWKSCEVRVYIYTARTAGAISICTTTCRALDTPILASSTL